MASVTAAGGSDAPALLKCVRWAVPLVSALNCNSSCVLISCIIVTCLLFDKVKAPAGGKTGAQLLILTITDEQERSRYRFFIRRHCRAHTAAGKGKPAEAGRQTAIRKSVKPRAGHQHQHRIKGLRGTREQRDHRSAAQIGLLYPAFARALHPPAGRTTAAENDRRRRCGTDD